MKSKNLNPLILASEDNEYDDSKNLAVKIVSIIVFLAMSLVFGLMLIISKNVEQVQIS